MRRRRRGTRMEGEKAPIETQEPLMTETKQH